MINKIEIERIKRGLSVADAASKANLSRSAWYRIVQGEREPKLKP
jgi:transcriptional regulator with XRE-family HTH domain